MRLLAVQVKLESASGAQEMRVAMSPGPWQELGASTFTFVGRNDRIVDWGLKIRQQRGLPPAKLIILVGSGVIEPFTIAALPLAADAQIVAIEVDPQLLDLGDQIKRGVALPWQTLAAYSKNPGRLNRDLLQHDRLVAGLTLLEALGSRAVMGPAFNEKQLRVVNRVADRVQLVGLDALSALAHLSDADIVGDFFVQVNINKGPAPNGGSGYSRRLVRQASTALAQHGLYLIGDTGKNLPVTLSHLARMRIARLNMLSMVHAVQQTTGQYTTSSYLVVSKMDDLADEQLANLVRANIAAAPALRNLPVVEQSLSQAKLALATTDRLNLAYIRHGSRSIAWNSGVGLDEALGRLVPRPGCEFSQSILLPAQKLLADAQ